MNYRVDKKALLKTILPSLPRTGTIMLTSPMPYHCPGHQQNIHDLLTS